MNPKQITLITLKNYYWLKSKLVAFCKQAKLSTVGLKQDLIKRIEMYLVTKNRVSIEQPKNVSIDKLAWICIKNKKLLCARSKGQTIFYIPGGKRDADESDAAALMREVKEELSVDLLAGTITYAHTFFAQAHGKPEGTRLKLTCYYADYEGEIKAAAEIEEAHWFNCQNKSSCSLPLQMVMDWLKERGEIE